MTFRLTQRRLELLAALDDLGGEYRQTGGRVRADLSRTLQWDATTTRRVIGDLTAAGFVTISGKNGRIDRIAITTVGVAALESRRDREPEVRRHLIGEDRDLTAERIKMRAEIVAARVVEWADQADLEAGVDRIRLQWNMAMHADLAPRRPSVGELQTEIDACRQELDVLVAAMESNNAATSDVIEGSLLRVLEMRTMLISMLLDAVRVS